MQSLVFVISMVGVYLALTKLKLDNIRIFSFRKIPVFLHASWVAFIGAIFINDVILHRNDLFNSLDKMLFLKLLLVHALVCIHEFGHSFTAQYFKYPVDFITFYPIGGLAKISGPFWKDNSHEFWITLFGPATNFVMAVIFSILYSWGFTNLFVTLMVIFNTVLLLFNLIPVFPMDGGRLTRSLLGYVMEDVAKIQHVTFIITLITLILIGFVCVVTQNYFIILILVFMAWQGKQELDAITEMVHYENKLISEEIQLKSLQKQLLGPDSRLTKSQFIKTKEYDEFMFQLKDRDIKCE